MHVTAGLNLAGNGDLEYVRTLKQTGFYKREGQLGWESNHLSTILIHGVPPLVAFLIASSLAWLCMCSHEQAGYYSLSYNFYEPTAAFL